MTTVLYLDASIFLYPALQSDAKAARAAEILRDVAAGDEQATTSSLTFDEVVWKIRQRFGRETALQAADNFLAIPNLRIAAVAIEHLRSARDLMARYARLDPRDAIHAAVALSVSAKKIASDDADFEGIAGLPRLSLD